MAYGSTAHKLFEVPELLGIIYGYTERRRRPRLLRISRAFFLAGAPLIWEEVVGIQFILRLLPSVSFRVYLDKDERRHGMVVVSSNLEEPTEFARFDLYTRFVKRLKAFSPDMASYRVTGWRHLSGQAKSRVFLPNLLELAITPTFRGMDQHLFLWIRMFLSPSLTSIVVGAMSDGSLSTIPGLAVKALLGHVGATCQNLRHLQIFSAAAEDGDSKRERSDYLFADFWEPLFFERLAGLRLQKLGCTTELLSPEWIHLLGEFSLLKSLDLYKVRNYEIANSQPKALPRLEHFGIHFASCNDVETIAGLGLLEALNSLTIVFRRMDAVVGDGWERSIILSISRNSPGLTKLHIEFDCKLEFMPEMLSFRPLGSLPLIEVCLKGGVCVPEDQLEDLAEIWPNVTRFEMWDTDEPLSLKDLQCFAKLPRVQHLALPVSWFFGVPPQATPTEPSYVLRTFEVLKHDFDTDFDVSSLAGYLLSLWPNLESVRWPWADKPQPSDLESTTIINALSNMVAYQHGFNRLKSRIIEKHGLEELDGLMK
ncbi:hypothetical protein FRC09_001823 [Ceratobasidium sp. 395]|nr:hypothetical protein FRC09_001823 [Ceratobasidium sp. 395]